MKDFNEVYNCDSITINLTNACNLACTYCFEHSKNPNHMDAKTAIDIIDKSYRKIPKEQGVFTINLFGGEPFLNWNTIKALIDHCNEKKYQVRYGVTTNLTNLTDEMIQYIDDNSIMMLVSIDGIKSVHDKNRCNSFDTVYSNMLRLVEAGLGMFIEARMTILPEDTCYALTGVDMLVNVGIDNICPMPVTDVEWSEDDIKGLEDFYISLMKYYEIIANSDSDRNVSIKNTEDAIVNIMSPDIDDPLMCPIYSDKWCAFDTNGDIYPCHQGPTSEEPFKSQMLIGNIYTGVDTSKIRNEDVFASYPKDECESCIGKSVCKCGCPTENMRETGVETTPSDGYCKTQIALVKAVREYHKRILNSSNIRSRMLNVLKENLKIKEYVDVLFTNTDLDDKFSLSLRIIHLQEMIENLGEDSIYPTFRDYIDKRLALIAAYQLDKSGMAIEEVNEKIKEGYNG